MNRFLMLSMAVFTLTACGKSDDVPAPAPTMAVIAQPIGTVTSTSNSYSMTTGLQGAPNAYYANYQFKENGCDTELRRFGGPAPEIVLAQMCAGLQNEWIP